MFELKIEKILLKWPKWYHWTTFSTFNLNHPISHLRVLITLAWYWVTLFQLSIQVIQYFIQECRIPWHGIEFYQLNIESNFDSSSHGHKNAMMDCQQIYLFVKGLIPFLVLIKLFSCYSISCKFSTHFQVESWLEI